MTRVETAAAPLVAPIEIEAVFAPFVLERMPADHPRWRAAVARLERKYAKPAAGARQWTTPDGRRTVDLVRAGYESRWGLVELEQQLSSSKPVHFEWRDEGMVAYAIGRKRVHLLLLARVLERLSPASVLEVGFGNGLNLLLLSMQFPGITFSGVELTAAGVAAARELAHDPETHPRLVPFATGPLHDPEAPRRLDLRQGTADALPLADKSVDVAITVLALEQMESIRDAALAELARVARRHVVMIEPFADWNADGHRREYIQRHHYFAARIADLPRFGLKPAVATSDMPNKLSFRAGLVVADLVEQI
jgi:ubiquinone/menaquinone biosynthesis C-methylase UbiE